MDKLWIAGLIGLAGLAGPAAAADRKPNIVVILADDRVETSQ